MNLNSIKSRYTALIQKPMVRGTLWMLLAKGIRIVLQAAYFVIIARALGADQYGAFVGVTALVAIVSPFVGWGGGDILIKHVSRNRTLFNEYWGNALLILFASGGLFLVLLLLGAQLILPKTIPLTVILLIGLSDLIFLRILDTAIKAFIAVDMMSMAAKLGIFATLKNLVATLCFISFFDKPGLIIWASLYSLCTAISAVISVILISLKVGYPKISLSRIKPEITEGFYFSLSVSSQTLSNDIDKTMLARFSTLDATGIYAAAYRLIDVACVPINSLVAAAYAKFFQQGAAGISGTFKLAKRLCRSAGTYGITATIALIIFAPVVPYVLGNEYLGVIDALRWLSPIIFIRALQYFGADALTGSGFQGIRSAVQISFALLNVFLNLWLIPQYSWRGAAWATLIADGLVMLSLWLVLWFLNQKQLQNQKNISG
jgi:O-antigen/teichoic acid export membrane protein